MDLQQVLEGNGYTMEDVLKWAQDKYPELLGNRELLLKLFAVERGIPLEIKRSRVFGPPVKIGQIRPDEPCTIQAVVVQKVESRTYIGCPKCFRKLNVPAGSVTECDKDGSVTASNLTWNSYLVGDDSGEIVVDTSPEIVESFNTGQRIAFRGSLRKDQVEFTAFAASKISPSTVLESTVSTVIPKLNVGVSASTNLLNGQNVAQPFQASTVTVPVQVQPMVQSDVKTVSSAVQEQAAQAVQAVQ
ncbi:MAG: hypothetical protein QXO47_10620, partial [Thermoproteota archaeon]